MSEGYGAHVPAYGGMATPSYGAPAGYGVPHYGSQGYAATNTAAPSTMEPVYSACGAAHAASAPPAYASSATPSYGAYAAYGTSAPQAYASTYGGSAGLEQPPSSSNYSASYPVAPSQPTYASAYGAAPPSYNAYGAQGSSYGAPGHSAAATQPDQFTSAPVGTYSSSFMQPSGSFVAAPGTYPQQPSQQQPFGGYSAYNYGGMYSSPAPLSTSYAPPTGSASYSGYTAYAAANAPPAQTSSYGIPSTASFTYNAPTAQTTNMPTAGSFTFTQEAYGNAGATYASSAYPYGNTTYGSVGGGSMLQSAGSFTSTPQFAFYPENNNTGPSHSPGASEPAQKTGAGDVRLADVSILPTAGGDGAGAGAAPTRKIPSKISLGKQGTTTQKKKKGCCC